MMATQSKVVSRLVWCWQRYFHVQHNGSFPVLFVCRARANYEEGLFVSRGRASYGELVDASSYSTGNQSTITRLINNSSGPDHSMVISTVLWSLMLLSTFLMSLWTKGEGLEQLHAWCLEKVSAISFVRGDLYGLWSSPYLISLPIIKLLIDLHQLCNLMVLANIFNMKKC